MFLLYAGEKEIFHFGSLLPFQPFWFPSACHHRAWTVGYMILVFRSGFSVHEVSVLLVKRETCLADLMPNFSLTFRISLPQKVKYAISYKLNA